jgi:hypothetical protein
MNALAPRYLFRSRWELSSRPDDVHEALRDVLRYPLWWPEFRDVRRIDDDTHWMVVRSFLPYTISYTLTQVPTQERGVLEARVHGDIDGRIRWRVTTLDDRRPLAKRQGPTRTIVSFEERVVTQEALLNLLAPFARWAFEMNHRLMMRDGLHGLVAFLAGRRR